MRPTVAALSTKASAHISPLILQPDTKKRWYYVNNDGTIEEETMSVQLRKTRPMLRKSKAVKIASAREVVQGNGHRGQS